MGIEEDGSSKENLKTSDKLSNSSSRGRVTAKYKLVLYDAKWCVIESVEVGEKENSKCKSEHY